MRLSEEQKSFLAGKAGAGTKKAMEILGALGKIYGARDMVPIVSAHISGVSYNNIGDPGLGFLRDWADMGNRARVPAFMNPAGVDRKLWKKLGISQQFATKQLEIIQHLTRLGIQPLLTCTPYHLGMAPEMGQHIAWSESSAIAYANSVLGARTNREGGPSALAAALAGYTPRFGLHLDAERRATHHIRISCRVENQADFGALGYLIGKKIAGGIPFFEGLSMPDNVSKATTYLKALGAAMAATGAVALFHIAGVTPEANALGQRLIRKDAVEIRIDNLSEAYAALKRDAGVVDMVAIGCPHASIEELNEIARLLNGKKPKARLWVTTSSKTREAAMNEGIAQIIDRAGGTIVADTCIVVAPLAELGIKRIATNSGKAASYLPSHQNAYTYFGTTEQCIQAAIEGKWTI